MRSITAWVMLQEKLRQTYSSLNYIFHQNWDYFVILFYLYFEKGELHENQQNYTGEVACYECGINIRDSITVLC